jgi:hypothetical protein
LGSGGARSSELMAASAVNACIIGHLRRVAAARGEFVQKV